MKTAIITATGPYDGGMSDQQFVRAIESFIETRSGWKVTVLVNAAPTTDVTRETAEALRQQPAPAGTPYVEPRTGHSEGIEPDLGLGYDVRKTGTNASTTRSS